MLNVFLNSFIVTFNSTIKWPLKFPPKVKHAAAPRRENNISQFLDTYRLYEQFEPRSQWMMRTMSALVCRMTNLYWSFSVYWRNTSSRMSWSHFLQFERALVFADVQSSPIQSNLYCKNTADKTQRSNSVVEKIENKKESSYEKAVIEVSRWFCTTVK